MKCPQCNAWSRAIDTRPRAAGTTARRYECANLHRFSTIEQLVKPKEPHESKH